MSEGGPELTALISVCITLLFLHFGNGLTNCSVNYRKLKGKTLFIVIG